MKKKILIVSLLGLLLVGILIFVGCYDEEKPFCEQCSATWETWQGTHAVNSSLMCNKSSCYVRSFVDDINEQNQVIYNSGASTRGTVSCNCSK